MAIQIDFSIIAKTKRKKNCWMHEKVAIFVWIVGACVQQEIHYVNNKRAHSQLKSEWISVNFN